MLDRAMIVRANAARLMGKPDPEAEAALADADRCLICYGTLAPGEANAHILAPLGGVWSEVTIRGRLVDEGWGAANGYPGLALDGPEGDVPAHAIVSAGLPHVWDALDHFEGDEYARILHIYRGDDGEDRVGNVYVLEAHAGIPA